MDGKVDIVLNLSFKFLMKTFYENYWKERGRSGNRPRYRIFSQWIDEGSKVLDIGCGDGYFGEFLVNNKRVDYTGSDISDTALQAAKSRGLNVISLDASNDLDRFAPGSFDFIVMSEFIEHIPNSEEVLRIAGRVAKKGVLISIPNIAYWKFRLQLLFGNFPKQWAVAPEEHLRYWSVDDFKKTVKSISFEIKEIKASNGKKILRDIRPNLFGFQVCFYLKPKSL